MLALYGWCMVLDGMLALPAAIIMTMNMGRDNRAIIGGVILGFCGGVIIRSIFPGETDIERQFDFLERLTGFSYESILMLVKLMGFASYAVHVWAMTLLLPFEHESSGLSSSMGA